MSVNSKRRLFDKESVDKKNINDIIMISKQFDLIVRRRYRHERGYKGKGNKRT